MAVSVALPCTQLQDHPTLTCEPRLRYAAWLATLLPKVRPAFALALQTHMPATRSAAVLPSMPAH